MQAKKIEPRVGDWVKAQHVGEFRVEAEPPGCTGTDEAGRRIVSGRGRSCHAFADAVIVLRRPLRIGDRIGAPPCLVRRIRWVFEEAVDFEIGDGVFYRIVSGPGGFHADGTPVDGEQTVKEARALFVPPRVGDRIKVTHCFDDPLGRIEKIASGRVLRADDETQRALADSRARTPEIEKRANEIHDSIAAKVAEARAKGEVAGHVDELVDANTARVRIGAPAPARQKFCVGDRVGNRAAGRSGRILEVWDLSVNVEYDDGQVERGVPIEHVSLLCPSPRSIEKADQTFRKMATDAQRAIVIEKEGDPLASFFLPVEFLLARALHRKHRVLRRHVLARAERRPLKGLEERRAFLERVDRWFEIARERDELWAWSGACAEARRINGELSRLYKRERIGTIGAQRVEGPITIASTPKQGSTT